VVQKNTINSKPQFIKSEPYPVPIDRWSTEYLPDTNYANLLKQYEGLVKELLSTNYFKDSLRIDSLGYVIIKDTVRKNMLIGSSFSYDLKYPIVKETRILPAIKKTQWFAGGFVQGEKGNFIDGIGAGLFIKNKRDQIFGAHAGLNTSGNLQIGISSYWKIKIKK
jgi:hypothetical protein